MALIAVTVHLKTQSQPIEHNHVINTYQKGDFYCLQVMKSMDMRIEQQNAPEAHPDKMPMESPERTKQVVPVMSIDTVEKSYKYPIADIFRVIEDYGFHGR